MEHLAIYFKHDIRDIIPYSKFIMKIRPALEQSGVGEYLGDDMAIDGGDAEGVVEEGKSAGTFTFLYATGLSPIPSSGHSKGRSALKAAGWPIRATRPQLPLG